MFDIVCQPELSRLCSFQMNGHNINFDNPTVLLKLNSSKIRLFVKETLHIKDQFAHKSLNVNIKSYECKLF